MNKKEFPFNVETWRKIDEWQSFTRNGMIVFVRIEHDQDTENPLTNCDGMGKILSLSHRHSNYAKSEIDELIESKSRNWVPLSYFEHGLCKWDVKGTMSDMPDFQWDGVSFAGAWVPDDVCIDEAKSAGKKAVKKLKEENSQASKEEITKTRREAYANRLKQMASEACEVYTSWCNGDCYYFRAEVFKAKFDDDKKVLTDHDDYEGEEVVAEDSCGGYIGDCGLVAIMADYIHPLLTKHLMASEFSI